MTPILAGKQEEKNNGNDLLMRILPLALCHKLIDFPRLIEIMHNVSALTHRHPRSQMSCGIYTLMAINLLPGDQPIKGYQETVKKPKRFILILLINEK